MRNFGAQVLQAFKDEDTQRVGIERAFNRVKMALKERKVGKREFSLFRAEAQKLLSPRPFVVASAFKNTAGTSKTERMSAFGVTAMSLTNNITPTMSGLEEMSTEELSPYHLLYGVTPSRVIRLTKEVPISFLDEHIHERLRERANVDLDYSDGSVSDSISLAMAFLYVLAPELEGKDIDMLPILIPHRDGLLLGHIETCPEMMFCPFGSVAEKVKGQFNEGAGLIDALHDWHAKGRIYFRTYIGKNEVKNEQEKVIARWQFLADEHGDTIHNVGEQYCDYGGVVEVDDDGWKALKADLLELYRSPEWQGCIRYGMKHLPDETYTSLVARQLSDLVKDFD